MPKSRNDFPNEGDFVVGRVENIQNQYVYVELLDYDGLPSEDHAKGMIHISEISSRWVKNIRNFFREGQRMVLRTTRVDPSKGHVDLSLRRTNAAQRKNKMKEWKYAVKIENLLQFLCNEYEDLTLEDAYQKIGFPVLGHFNDNYQETIEELKENGEEILEHLTDISEDMRETFLKIVNENVEISTVNIVGKIKLRFDHSNGVDLVKETLIETKNVLENPKETRNLEISYIAAPHYRVEIVSKDYLDAENILSDALEVVEEKADKYNALYEFSRE